MPRYIDAEPYEGMCIMKLFTVEINIPPYKPYTVPECTKVRSVNDIPTADVQEVVRCKDCKHRDPEDKKCDGIFCAKNGLFPMDDNDYCSYGERKANCSHGGARTDGE